MTAATISWLLLRNSAKQPPTMAPIPLSPLEPDDDPTVDLTYVHPPVPDVEPTVRVRVLRVRDDREVTYIGSEGQWLRVRQQEQLGEGMALRGPLRVRVGAMGWSVIDALGFTSLVTGSETCIVRADPLANEQSDDPLAGSAVALQGHHYPGELHLVSRSSIAPAAFDIVNHVPLETYLPGVVSRELYSHWHEETFAAQAIAARSFACSEHAYFLNRRHFDLTDNQSSQVYAGITTHPTSIDSVTMTRGKVLAYQGLLVPGYYSSCCGGTAAVATDAIGPNPINDIPPLRGRSEPDVCDKAPVCSWQTQRPVEMATRRLNAWGKMRGDSELASLGRLSSIQPIAYNQHGRPTRFVLQDVDNVAVEINAERLRAALNHAELGLHPPARAMQSSHFTATVHDEDFVFEGYGYGHGVGLCQHGAQIRARAGHSHEDILQWYYPGADIVAAYE